MFAYTSFVLDPVAPWSLPSVGVSALVVIALVIAGVTVVTYLLGKRGSWLRFSVMLFLRLAALAVVLLLLLRPSLAHYEDLVLPSKLLFLNDASQSMAINDEFNNQSRWDNALRLQRSQSVADILKKLQNQQRTQIVKYQAAVDVKTFDPDSKPDGKRTEMGYWLNRLFERHGGEKHLRALIVFSDGADNGTRFNAVEEARKWRGIGCPIYAIGLGSPTTTPNRKDISFDPNSIQTHPTPVYVKGKMKVKALVDAPGFAWTRVTMRLLINGKEKAINRDITLEKAHNNEIEMECDAPETPGDYKVTLKIDPEENEVSKQNNEISTFVTVTKEGLSILWVEGKLRLESSWAVKRVLRQDPRFRVYYTEQLRREGKDGDAKDALGLDRRHYDVIVIGDVSAQRFSGGNVKVFDQINELVKDKGTGVLMLGGFETFGNSDWQNQPKITAMMPVDLQTAVGQIQDNIRVVPTVAGFDHYILRLDDNPDDNRNLWENPDLFGRLKGMSRLGTVKQKAELLAKSDGGQPIMAFNVYGKGRVLAFGGDTTYMAWNRNRFAHTAYKRFWNRLMRWLARQEKIGSDVYVKLNTRRIPAGGGHSVNILAGLNNENPENKNKNVKFRVHVLDPNQNKIEVSLFPEDKKSDRRQTGYFLKTDAPGEYQVVAEAVDDSGKRIGETAEARFLAYPEDLENLRPAANHEHLTRIAQASSGQFRLAGERELEQLLRELAQQTAPKSRPRGELWPQWNREPESNLLVHQVYTLWSSGVLACYLAFCTLICLEWYLRRRWDMV